MSPEINERINALDFGGKNELKHIDLKIKHQRLVFDRWQFIATMLGVALTACGLVYGGMKFIENNQIQANVRQQNFESQLALDFLALKNNEERKIFLLNLDTFNELDPAFIAKLKKAVRSPIDLLTLNANIPMDTRSDYATALSNLIDKKSSIRALAIDNLTSIIVTCGETCLNDLISHYDAESLFATKRYRLAFGITKVLENLNIGQGDLLEGLQINTQIKPVLNKLSRSAEPEISFLAARVLAKL